MSRAFITCSLSESFKLSITESENSINFLIDWLEKSLILSTDDYYETDPESREAIRKERSLDYVGLNEILWDDLIHTISFLNNGIQTTIRRINKCAGQVELTPIYKPSLLNTIIIEGLYAGKLKEHFKNAYSVYLQGNPKDTLEFRKKRNKENDGDKFREEIVQKEYKVVQQLKKYADLVIPFKR